MNYLSTMVFSRSTNAPPQINRISFVSICIWSPRGCFLAPFPGTFTIWKKKKKKIQRSMHKQSMDPQPFRESPSEVTQMCKWISNHM
jgi:hypothetical protein